MQKRNLIGQRFGRLVVIGPAESKNGKVRWLCRCDCGNLKIAYKQSLLAGATVSCGCKSIEHAIEEGKKRLIHGETDSRLYKIWVNMRFRCRGEKHPGYKYYGDRGIKVCDEWNNNYSSFKEWALANGYRDSLTLDRIDVNRDYSPDNCRWATNTIQQRNKRNNHVVLGKTISEWSEITGINRSTLYSRINHSGIPPEKAILTSKL